MAILAGGQATRLGDLAKDQPKSLVKVQGKPFLEYQLEMLRRGGIEDVVLCIGHLGEQIAGYFGDGQRWGLKIKYSTENTPLGTGGALKLAAPLLNDIFFTMYGDSYLFLDFQAVMHFFQSRDKLALMTVYKNQDRYDRSNTELGGGLVKKYSKTERSQDMVYIEYGASVFRKAVLDLIPQNGFYPLEELYPRLVDTKQLLAFEVKERFYEIGSTTGIAEFSEYVRSGLN